MRASNDYLLSRDNWNNIPFYLETVKSRWWDECEIADYLLSRDNCTNILFFLQAVESPAVGRVQASHDFLLSCDN